MAEGMNQMNQEQLMLVDGFESLVKALGTEIPIGLAEDLAAVRNGMPMPPEMQRILAEGSMRLGQQLKDQGGMPNMMNNTNPDIMKDSAIRDSNMGSVSDSEMQMAQDSLARLGLAPMTEEEMMSYQVDGGMEQMTRSQMAGMQESGAITPNMQMRPQARPTAPMQSPRPQMRR